MGFTLPEAERSKHISNTPETPDSPELQQGSEGANSLPALGQALWLKRKLKNKSADKSGGNLLPVCLQEDKWVIWLSFTP